jgi:hypothetical protein
MIPGGTQCNKATLTLYSRHVLPALFILSEVSYKCTGRYFLIFLFVCTIEVEGMGAKPPCGGQNKKDS